jgi:Na+/H+ antiporter NhaD/arsenite permease-like protein
MPLMSLLAAVPFVLLLAAIAVLPLAAEHWWHSNRNKGWVAAGLALPVVVYLCLHPGGGKELLHAVEEYAAFIIMLGALFGIAGGIAITGDLPAKPTTNTAFLAIGALLANVIGTTGASMLLIRLVLQTNRERKHVRHIPVFFIFIVSNCGGLLTPLGDPPLFLGFLHGVPFEWTLRLWPQWLFANGLLLMVFLIWDMRAYGREAAGDVRRDHKEIRPLRVQGAMLNGPLLAGVVAAVLLKSVTPFGVAEVLMLVLVGVSLWKTPRTIRATNQFEWFPIIEVAVLFAGIFVCMVPALDLLKQNAPRFGVTEPWQYFWLTGLLSSLLDNAPTYLSMGEMAAAVNGLTDLGPLSTAAPKVLAAISCGAVFMGANTYIGNGPNFMVKAIAEQNGYRMPSFFGYIGYAVAVLLPIWVGVMLVSFL